MLIGTLFELATEVVEQFIYVEFVGILVFFFVIFWPHEVYKLITL